MTRDTPVPTAAEDLESRLSSVAEIDIEVALIRTIKLGEDGDFSAWRNLFEELVQFAGSFSGFSWQKLSSNRLANARNHLVQVERTLEQIQGYSPGGNRGRGQDQGDLALQLQRHFDSFKEEVVPYFGYLVLDSIDLEKHKRRLERTVAEGSESLDHLSAEYRQRIEHLMADANGTIARFSDEIQATRSEAEAALKEARAIAAEAGVTQEAGTFREAANRYEALAKRWLWGSVGSALATVGVGILIVFFWNTIGEANTGTANGPSTAAVLQAILGRAAVVAVLSYATLTAVRMYRSSSHLAVVNRHREDSLKTFRTFVEGADTEETKRQILLAAAHAAFGQTATGLIGEKADGGNTLEVLEGLFGRSVRSS